MKKYLVTCEEDCIPCGGTGIVQHWQWAEFLAAHGNNFTLAQSEEWFSERNGLDEYGYAVTPDGEQVCPDCEGAGKLTSFVSLAEALASITQEVKN